MTCSSSVISIVTPSFNQADLLPVAIHSVISQAPSNLEYIVVDGGSDDSTSQILDRYVQHFAHCLSQPDRGHAHALNKGFSLATGELMGWINSDDFLLPGALQTVIEIFKLFPEIQWLTTLMPVAADIHGRLCLVRRMPGICSQAILDGAYLPDVVPNAYGHIQQESTFWRRSLWEVCGGYISEQHGLAADYELWQRFARVAEPVGVSVPLGVFRMRTGQASEGERYVNDLRQIWLSDQARHGSSHPARLRRQLSAMLPASVTARHPRVLKTLPKPFRYQGKRIVRRNPQGPHSSWQLESHLFL